MKLLPSLFLMLSQGLWAGSNSLQGQIQDAQGLPVAGAAVYLDGREAALVTVTDLHGGYAFTGLEDGDYKVRAWEGLRASASQQLSLRGGSSQFHQARLDRATRLLPLTLKIRPSSGEAESRTLSLELDATMTASEALESGAVAAYLATLKGGEYELVMAWPGLAYVGTCVVLKDQAASGGQRARVLHTGGMEIAGNDFVEALSEQASDASKLPHRL